MDNKDEMSKYKFISKEKSICKLKDKKIEEDISFQECGVIKLKFNNNSPVIKTQIQENLKKQLKKLLASFSEERLDVQYFKVNQNTKNKLRIFYSYEIDYVPKDLKENRIIGKVIGVLMGIKIVLDDRLNDNEIVPITVKLIDKTVKMNFVFKN